LKTYRESDSLILLRDGNADHRGEGVGKVTQAAKETSSGHAGLEK